MQRSRSNETTNQNKQPPPPRSTAAGYGVRHLCFYRHFRPHFQNTEPFLGGKHVLHPQVFYRHKCYAYRLILLLHHRGKLLVIHVGRIRLFGLPKTPLALRGECHTRTQKVL